LQNRQAGATSPRRQPEDVSGKNFNEAFREIDELCERWDNSLSIKNLALAERYIKGELEFGFVFKWQQNPYVSEDFVAIFERKVPLGSSRHRSLCHAPRSLIRYVVLYSEHLLRCGYGDEQFMIVGDVNAVETPYGVVSSTVRLQTFREFDSLWRGSIDTSNGTGLKVGGIRTYWERCIVRGYPAIGQDKSRAERKLWTQSPRIAPHLSGMGASDRKWYSS